MTDNVNKVREFDVTGSVIGLVVYSVIFLPSLWALSNIASEGILFVYCFIMVAFLLLLLYWVLKLSLSLRSKDKEDVAGLSVLSGLGIVVLSLIGLITYSQYKDIYWAEASQEQYHMIKRDIVLRECVLKKLDDSNGDYITTHDIKVCKKEIREAERQLMRDADESWKSRIADETRKLKAGQP